MKNYELLFRYITRNNNITHLTQNKIVKTIMVT